MTTPLVFDFINRRVIGPTAPIPQTEPQLAHLVESVDRRPQLRVDWVIPCRYVEVNGALATMVGAGSDILMVPSVPVPVQLSLAVRLLGLPDDAQHRLTVEILGPNMEPTTEPLWADLVAQPNDKLPTGWENGLLIPTIVAFEAASHGVYTVNVAVDGNSKSIPVQVLPIPEQ